MLSGQQHAQGLLLRTGYRLLRAAASLTAVLPEAVINRASQMGLDAGLTLAALVFAYLLRFDGAIPPAHRSVMWSLAMLLPLLRPLLMLALGAYDAIWRYFNLRDAAVLAFSALPVSLLLLAFRYLLGKRFSGAVVPAGVIIIEFGLYLALAAGLRVFRRVSYEVSRPPESRPCRALLVGTESTLPHALRHLSASTEVQLVGVLAPEPKLQGLRIGGSLVMEQPPALPRLLVSQRIDLVLIADSRPDWIGEVVATANEFGADVRLLPAATHVIRGDVRVSAQADPEALVSRPRVEAQGSRLAEPDPLVIENFRERVVLITGAGGSIGSELARQIALLPASTLVLLDRDENSVFELSNSLAAQALDLGRAPRIVPVVGDVRNFTHLSAIFEEHHPRVVLHAAAYKHVPIMESNVCEAVLNNVFGTRAVALAATQFAAERLVMISTDKAVHPSSVMGATKRIAEMLITEIARQHRLAPNSSFTRMACVRFGNVVGSRGSVVPIFQRQIAEGGPITITDEHMTRYFMTIPEAAQLVLQAASLASDGDVYMLEMGDAMKITALARKVIEHSGLRPDKDIEIRFVGARPGEKIAEQLWHDEAELRPTFFPNVLQVKNSAPPADFSAALAQLEQAAQTHAEAATLEALRAMPIGFAPSPQATPPAAKARAAFVN
jgi:FlaA1/EpsC-like NDP-sugar epimerase